MSPLLKESLIEYLKILIVLGHRSLSLSAATANLWENYLARTRSAPISHTPFLTDHAATKTSPTLSTNKPQQSLPSQTSQALSSIASTTSPLPIISELSAIHVEGESKHARLTSLKSLVSSCTICSHLAASRTQTVFGVGNPEARLMFVGEAPGKDEDEQGEPFVGAAGQLLTRMITAMGLSRDQVYIANVLKCRPDMPPGAQGNRKPTHEEMRCCLPYLLTQIQIIQPQVIVALGATAVEGLLGEKKISMTKIRGTLLQFQGIPLIPTYHPAYLLYNPSIAEKRKVWEDLMLAMQLLGLPISDKQRSYFLPQTTK
ncbi:MAG: uracil-DNA glycosylase [Verrucomicrobiae bacterium]|nr:uracil-DNA glycosylase [Verrucomicrobiae bacterium]